MRRGVSSSELEVHGVDGVVVLAAWGGTVARSLVGVPASSRSSRVDDGLLGRCSGGDLALDDAQDPPEFLFVLLVPIVLR